MKTYNKVELIAGIQKVIDAEKKRVSDAPKAYEKQYRAWRKGVSTKKFSEALRSFDARVAKRGFPTQNMRYLFEKAIVDAFGTCPTSGYVQDQSDWMERALTRLIGTVADKNGNVKVSTAGRSYRSDPLLGLAQKAGVEPIVGKPRPPRAGIVPFV